MSWKEDAKNSLNVREWRESGKRLIDPAAVPYLRIARTILGGLIHQLKLGGIEYGHRIVTLPDGAIIRVLHNSGINNIEIRVPTLPEPVLVPGEVVLFLESGWEDIRGLPHGFSAKVYYTKAVLELYDLKQWTDWARLRAPDDKGRILEFELRKGEYTKGMPSLGAFGLDYLATLPEEVQRRLAGGTVEELDDPITGKKWSGKYQWFMERCHTMTGKIKLLMQAWIGMYQQSMPLSTDGWYGLTGNDMQSSVGLMTTDDYQYWLVFILGSGAMDFYPILFTPVGEQLRVQMAKNIKENKLKETVGDEVWIGTELTQWEAYLFTKIERLGPRQRIALDLSPIQGEPFWYGWKFDWKGRRAAVVCNQPIIGRRPGQHVDYIRKHTTHLYEITLDYKVDKEGVYTFEAEIKEEETQDWTPNPVAVYLVKPWGRDYTVPNGYEFFRFTVNSPYELTLMDHDAPVYCWYDAKDDLALVRHAFHRDGNQTKREVSSDGNSTNNVFDLRYTTGPNLNGIYKNDLILCTGQTKETTVQVIKESYRTGYYVASRSNLYNDKYPYTDKNRQRKNVYYGQLTAVEVCNAQIELADLFAWTVVYRCGTTLATTLTGTIPRPKDKFSYGAGVSIMYSRDKEELVNGFYNTLIIPKDDGESVGIALHEDTMNIGRDELGNKEMTTTADSYSASQTMTFVRGLWMWHNNILVRNEPNLTTACTKAAYAAERSMPWHTYRVTDHVVTLEYHISGKATDHLVLKKEQDLGFKEAPGRSASGWVRISEPSGSLQSFLGRWGYVFYPSLAEYPFLDRNVAILQSARSELVYMKDLPSGGNDVFDCTDDEIYDADQDDENPLTWTGLWAGHA